MPRPSSRPPVLVLGAAVAVLAAATLPAGTALAAPAADPTSCTATSAPGLSSGGAVGTDATVSVLAGRSLTLLPGTAELEGVVLAGGDVVSRTGGLVNVGRVGSGSQIVPPGGSDMLVAGGDVTVADGRLDVGHGIAGGGDVVAGEAITGTLELNGGAAHPGTRGAGQSAERLVGTLQAASERLAALPATGTVVTSGASTVLRGDGTSATQVFDLTATQLRASDDITLVDVPAGAGVVVDVAGAVVDYDVVHLAAGTVADRIDAPRTLGAWAGRLVWNLPDATTVTLGSSARASQLVGSVLVPQEDAEVTSVTHTNGRLWVAGDLTVGGANAGLEHHAFPSAVVTELGCTPAAPGETSTPEDEPAAPAPGEPAPGGDVPATGTEETAGPVSRVVTAPGSTPAAADDVPLASTGGTPAAPAGADRAEPGTLAQTGTTAGLLGGAALLLVLAGGATVWLVRRRAA